MCVHMLHTVHALPDLRVAGGRLGDGVLSTLIQMPLKKLISRQCKRNRKNRSSDLGSESCPSKPSINLFDLLGTAR